MEKGKNKIKLEKMADEATVDCYDEYEQFSGWACTLEDELPLPLKCIIFGGDAILVDVNLDDGGLSVLGIIIKDKNKIRIPIQDVIAADKKAKGLEWIEAYRYWVKGN